MSDWKQLNVYIDAENFELLKKCMRLIDPFDITTKVVCKETVYLDPNDECPCDYIKGMCDNCGNIVKDEMRYCPYCGFKLDWSKE